MASDDPVTPTVPVPIRLTIDDGTGPPAVTIVANLGAGQSEVLTAGSVTGATDGYDEDHDLLAAAPGGSPVTAWFPRAEWLVPGGDRFRTDLRAPYDDSISYKSWRFAVAAAEAGQVELTFAPDPADASETGRHLVDRSTGQIHDLRASATYTYAAGAAEVREFTLRLGDGLPAQDPGDREITATWSMVGASLSPPAGATLQDVILSQAPVASWLFRWEPTAANYIILPGTSPCLQGQGIWLYAPQRFAWEMSGSPNTAEIHVPLARGWTMVGYPLWFRGDLSGTVIEHAGVRYSFTDAVARGLVAGMMFDFDDRGYYRATTELVPWHGYWAASYADDVTLHFHHEWMEDPQLLPSPRAPSVKRLPTDWTTTVRIDGAGDGIVLGRSGRATDGFDAAWDLPAPPPSPLPAASATISLPRPEWAPAIAESFLSDVRAAGEQPLVFPARVTAAAAGVVCLSWERGELPDGVDLEIRSGGRTLVASMRAVGSVEVAVGETPLDLQFATTNGLPEAAWLIEGLRLRNQPNPFNPSTDFRFNLAAGGDTRLLIYDARGTLVQEIEAGQLPAGPAQLTWNGVDRRGQVVASGVYLYRLIQDGRQLGGTRKMVLLK
ncbi:hypothetical protein FJ250_11525 [bacterium]|nr:hypothetical protein [bacterium]